VVVARRFERCQHLVCNRDDSTPQYGGSRFCIVGAIKRAREATQLDGELPAERGNKTAGVEYTMTIEAIAGHLGLSVRSVEKTLHSALAKLRADPRATELLHQLAPEPERTRSRRRHVVAG
jgi:hypothetical protein